MTQLQTKLTLAIDSIGVQYKQVISILLQALCFTTLANARIALHLACNLSKSINETKYILIICARLFKNRNY